MMLAIDCWKVQSSPDLKRLALEDGVVHVWRTSDALPPGRLSALAEPLASDERLRATKFRFKPDRMRYAICRGLLRRLLGHYLNRAPASLKFDTSGRGKPFLPDVPELAFNVSHTRGMCLLAFTRGREIGVDVEAIDARVDLHAMMRTSLHARELAALVALPADEQQSAFFSCWTCKEAYLKARGWGLHESMSAVELVLPAPKQEDVAVRCSVCPDQDYWIRALEPGPGFAAAIACPNRPASLHTFDWQAKPDD